VLIAGLLGVNGTWLALVALAAVVGHVFPLYFKFKGGKGVATAFGAVLALSPVVAIVSLIIWILVVFVTRYVSLGSLIATGFGAVLILFTHLNYFIPVALIALLIIWRHMENIDRLKAGTENKIEFGKKP